MIPSFEVPPQYFYALAASMPPGVSPAVRYRLATLSDQVTVLDVLRQAVETGTIKADPTVTVEMAARRLSCLGSVQGVSPVCASGVGLALTTAYAAYRTTPPDADPAVDVAPFWDSVMATPALAKAHLELVLCAITLEADSRPLITAAAGDGLPLDSVRNLDVDPWPLPHPPEITYADWHQFFTGRPDLLPPSVGPGSLEERIGAFVRLLRAFDVTTGALGPGPATPGSPGQLPRPHNDLIQGFFDAYRGAGHATWEWGDGFTAADRAAAVATLGLDDAGAAWLTSAVDALDGVYASTAITGVDDALRFSLAESLWARGFSTRESITALSLIEFTDAVIGTPAHDRAQDLWTAAGGDPNASHPGAVTGPFAPVNPGDLVNCQPPPELSPTADIAYLQALLNVDVGAATLGSRLAERAGPLGDLAATSANATVAVPAIDLVNESLEAMVATGDPHGVVYDTEPADAGAHDPAAWLQAVPSHSSPAVPVAEPAAYDTLAGDFSAPELPYDQRLDVSRRYLEAMGTTRFDVRRGLRRDITEFVLDRDGEPASFPRHVWRYPVRLDIALEYLCISPTEYEKLFSRTPRGGFLATVYGFGPDAKAWQATAASLPELLERLGLRYCDLVELLASGYVGGHLEHTGGGGEVRTGGRTSATADAAAVAPPPRCEPCCPADYAVVLDRAANADPWARLAVFVRLWHKLRCTSGLSFAELAQVCTVLGLFDTGGTVNQDFVPQLAAMQMLREHLRMSELPMTQLLELWRDPAAQPPDGVVETLLDHVAQRARRHGGHERGVDFRKLLRANLDTLSALCGFDPATAAKTWHARPAHSLRFAEQLGKIYASGFGIGELTYLCTAGPHLAGDDPYPLASDTEAEVDPLHDPDDVPGHSLWDLRRRLLDVEPAAVESYTWARIADVLRDELGADPAGAGLTSLGAHLFPGVLAAAGIPITPGQRRYTTALAGSSAAMWNSGASPLRYDDTAGELSATVPFDEDAVLTKLSRIRPLLGQEPAAVRNLYAAPRLELARFGYLFADLDLAVERLVAEPDENARWEWFRSQFALFHARCGAVVRHLAEHVLSLDGGDPDDVPDGGQDRSARETAEAMAWRLLRVLRADENAPVTPSWENDDGHRPDVTWGPTPVGGAFAAITGLVGTGLLAEHAPTGAPGAPLWRELRGSTALYGTARGNWNAPAPTILPALDAALPPAQRRWAGVRNSIGIAGRGAQVLGGIEGFHSRWSGLLLVEADGDYTFWGGAGRGERDERPDAATARRPDADHIDGQHWQVRLGRGQKQWVLLSRGWTDHPDCLSSSGLTLRRGVYDLRIELVRDAPGDDELEDARALRCGLRIEYRGPDTGGDRTVVPTERLYLATKDGMLDAGTNEKALTGGPRELLRSQYVSTLRDARRTYQRAFKSLLLAYRFGLSARTFSDYAQSELGYLLEHGDTMAGVAFYDNGAWHQHAVDFDPNLLPLRDTYHPAPADDRGDPSMPRRQAWFDVWERLFDHVDLRARAGTAPEDPAWLLYDEAAGNQPDNPAQLLRHLGIDLSHADLVLSYDPGFAVNAPELTDERWPTRVWHADQVVRRVVRCFAVADLAEARPDLWAATDPLGSGGNLNLTRLVRAGYVDHGTPKRFRDLRHLDDCLRVHARDALVAYLTRLDRVPLPGPGTGSVRSAGQLSDLLLLDVETATEARGTRVDAAIAAAQGLVARARLGLEAPWRPDAAFVQRWDCHFASCEVWGAWRRTELYPENGAGWAAQEHARRTEAFRFLEGELRQATLTMPVPGGLQHWNAGGPPRHPGLALLQARDAARLAQLSPAREGLGLLGTPDRSGQRSWLAAQARGDSGDSGGRDPDGRDSSGVVAVRSRGETPLPSSPGAGIPLWIEAAIRLGARFLRVPAAGVPPASQPFAAGPAPVERAGPCLCGCDGGPGASLDEYYFWLADTAWFDHLEQVADWPGWHDASTAAPLLEWPAKPAVHLMWSHVRDGEIRQPRRSVGWVAVPEGASAATTSLTLVGRQHDSLLLDVGGGREQPGAVPPPGPGFRYDLATDEAVVVPQVTPDAVVTPQADPGLGALTAYPYFVYFSPGAPLFPADPTAEAITVACALRTHCAYEAATRWYGVAHDPMTGDNRWHAHIDAWVGANGAGAVVPVTRGRGRAAAARAAAQRAAGMAAASASPAHGDGRHNGTGNGDAGARRRHVTMEYVETLLEWAQCSALERTSAGRTRSRLILDSAARILGPTPVTLRAEPERPDAGRPEDRRPEDGRAGDGATTGKPANVATFVPAGAPLNPRLMSLYGRVADRRAALAADPAVGGDCACACGFEDCGCASCGGAGLECCCPASPYRFSAVLARAADFAGQVSAFGAELAAALEKGDTELLSAVRLRHEQQVLGLNRAIRKEQWRDADWQVQGLRIGKQIAQTKYLYFDGLITQGLIAGEIDYRELENGSFAATGVSSVAEAIGVVMGVIPDVFVGTVNYTQLPLGTKLAHVFEGVSRISGQVATILAGTGGLRITEAGWDRRLVDWAYQRELADLEIAQAQRQILAAERRRATALGELNSTEQQIGNVGEVVELVRDKTTSHAHYLWLARETAALYRQMYELADCTARQAEHAFNVERGFTHRRFVPDRPWQGLHEGLTAGQHLALAVRRMDAAYTSENTRDYELTKHISLRKFFGAALLALKVNGQCTVELPEWLFDLDYPGHYLRRLKSVSLTIPAVVGPYTGIHARLTLLSNTTRVEPRLLGPARGCCDEVSGPAGCGCGGCGERGECGGCADCAGCGDGCRRGCGSSQGYALACGDCRSVRDYGSRQAIATSTGQNDSGLFELAFRDERYLPFEYAGAVSTWQLEIPPENNDFDLDTVADVVMHVNYTAREGGPVLRAAAAASAREHIPDAGQRLIDLVREMPQQWARFTGEGGYRRLDLLLSRDYFACVTGRRGVRVRGLELFMESAAAHPSSHVDVEFEVQRWACCEPAVEYSFSLVGASDFCGFFHGALAVDVGPVTGVQPRPLGSFEFEEPVTDITRMFLLVHYELVDAHHA